MRKNIIIILVFMFFPLNVLAISNPYPTTQTINGEVSIPCTRVAWQEAYDRLGVALPSNWGNAVNWLKNAKRDGYQTGTEPRPNSIAVYSGSWGYGHVAYVLEVKDDRMHIIQGGVTGMEKDEGWSDYVIGSGYGTYLMGFIYLDQIPQKSSSSSNNSSNNSSSSSTSTSKSGDSYLKNVVIEGLDFDFQKDVYLYNLSVPYETSKIKIEAEAQSSKAKISGVDEYQLEVGDNNIILTVTAQDDSSSTYAFVINRGEQKIEDNNKVEEKEVKEEVKLEKSKEFKFNYIYVVIPIVILIIIGIGFKRYLKK